MLSVHLLPTLLDEGLNPCPPDGAGCRQIGSVLAVPIASEFKISVSPLVVGVGEKLTVRLSSALPRCTAQLIAGNTRCWSSVSWGDTRLTARYLPLGYNGVFMPPRQRSTPPVSAPRVR